MTESVELYAIEGPVTYEKMRPFSPEEHASSVEVWFTVGGRTRSTAKTRAIDASSYPQVAPRGFRI